MGFDQGHFAFDSPNLTYYPGQVLHGKLVFDQEKNKKFRGIYVKIKGKCDVHWVTHHTRKSGKNTVHYTKNHNSHETYFDTKIYLIGGPDNEVHLQPGHHEFPFDCQIPVQCPSSYEGSYGKVYYKVKAVVDRAFKFDQEKEANFTVVAPKDLNVNPYCKEPMVFDFKESYYCCCTSSGTCEVVARVPQSGYCPGQTVNIELDCANRSNVEISSIQFEIKERIKFIATHHPGTRKEKRVVAKLSKGPVPPNTTRNWAVELDIPQMDVWNLDHCSFIDIDYEFEVTVSPDGCHSSTEASRELVIGTLPLREIESNVPLAPYPGIQPSIESPVANQPYMPPQTFPTNQPYQMPGYPGPPPAVSPYPTANLPYPGGNLPYPVEKVPHSGENPTYPGANSPYPGGNSAYPGGNPPYPGGNSPYPGGNPPHPGSNPPYSGGNPPYPGSNSSYPGGNPPPYPGGNPLYPGGNPPYPVGNPPYPGGNPPYPGGNPGSDIPGHEKDASVPLLPPTVPYQPPMETSPFAKASAPEPTSPNYTGDKDPLAPPAYNPDVVKSDHN